MLSAYSSGVVAVASRSTATMETRSTARNRTSIDHGAEDAPAAERGCFPEMQALTRTTRRPRSWPPPTSWEVNNSEPSHLTPPMPKTPHLGLRLARRLAGI